MKFAFVIHLRLLATAILAVTSTSILGEMTGTPMLSTWNGPVQMAYPTAACFVLTAAALFILSMNHHGKHYERRNRIS